MNTVLSEAKRLHDLGFAVLPLHSKSKRPKGNGWTQGPRLEWPAFKASFENKDNIGVRTGSPSKLRDSYLACIDVDIKNPAYGDRAQKLLMKLTHGVECPEVTSGSGNGSKHLYCLTKKPFKMLTIDKCEDGEICVYSNGRQMVLPPSIHPSGKPYKWTMPVTSVDDLPVIEFKIPEQIEENTNVVKNTTSKESFTFTPVDVEIEWLPLSKTVLSCIKDGTGVTDRSAFLLTATTALTSCGLDKNEILSVLTDPRYFISKCGESRRGKNRQSQAQWLWEYTVNKVMLERSVVGVFTKASDVKERKLSTEEIEAQSQELSDGRHWSQDLKRAKGGIIIGNVENVVTILTNAVGPDIVKRNEFAYRDTYGIETPWGTKVDVLLSDDEVVKIKYWLGQNYNFEPKNQTIEESLIIIACKNAYDPVKNWLTNLPKWDEVPRLGTWLRENFQAKGDTEYLSQVFTKWLLAMVARAFRPGLKFDWMPIFEGKQGIGKSSFGRLLVGDQYFLDSLPNITDKDAALALQGIWSVEMGELANMRRTQLEDVKGFITRTIDKVRPPYGKRWIESPRRCVFFGTTNRQTYLVDDTGNRRFKPLEVGRLDFKALKRDRDQLFAEAKHIFDTEVISELTFELQGQAKVFEAKIHQDKMVEDESTVMFEAMKIFLERVEKEGINFDFDKFKMSDLFGVIGGVIGPLNMWKMDSRNCQFAAKMLKRFGGQKRPIRGLMHWKIEKGDRFDDLPITPDFY